MGQREQQPKIQSVKARACAGMALFAFAMLISGCDITSNKLATKGSATGTSTNTRTTSTTATTTSTAGRTLTISWDPNRETAVNSTGGGYRIYYSTTNPVPAGATSVNLSYSTAATLTPATTNITGLASGTYYIVVVAYSTLKTAGNTSTQISVVMP